MENTKKSLKEMTMEIAEKRIKELEEENKLLKNAVRNLGSQLKETTTKLMQCIFDRFKFSKSMQDIIEIQTYAKERGLEWEEEYEEETGKKL